MENCSSETEDNGKLVLWQPFTSSVHDCFSPSALLLKNSFCSANCGTPPVLNAHLSRSAQEGSSGAGRGTNERATILSSGAIFMQEPCAVSAVRSAGKLPQVEHEYDDMI